MVMKRRLQKMAAAVATVKIPHEARIPLIGAKFLWQKTVPGYPPSYFGGAGEAAGAGGGSGAPRTVIK